MNRIIKFRGFQPEQKRWYFGDLIKVNNGGAFIFNYDGNFENRVLVDPESIGQFSGINDDSGKGHEIFEGDIYKSSNGRLWEVRFGKYIYCAGTHMEESPCVGWYLHSRNGNIPISNTGLVIGNIHENAELLK
jgi:uncharacterized phage protein (TIGR01671 family)